jgi:transmembrane sensor
MWFLAAAAVVGNSVSAIDPMRPQHYKATAAERVIDCRNNHITLHRQSQLAIQCGPNLLRANLMQGEASFQVADDNSSAAIVLTGDAQVDAVGSKFVVRRDPDRSTVTVLEGFVTLDERPVWAGERAAVVNTRVVTVGGETWKHHD